ncbi:xanthine dehydrogenase accessory protein XdhC [Herminiimonas sp. KBW02]|uniref:xanthine dehydrogenase accessory protein XdhC n=1 Tax=Herminiimonas sp. KBW02 TaxID=2153363 RepID=UPI000F593507|nr:xanthine dehydrogenase accessory protein XdhC [Herminiimonas sp. KBW02]RQO32813.1 xanthine dehydrogenase accessory protein XdhC [Herminiimonas sp. KBW02]
MSTWLEALQTTVSAQETCVLVTVAGIQGSTPREEGARMVYTATQQFDTIGGGHLEWRAAQIARDMLADITPNRRMNYVERIALGPSLGQCCGGVVFLAFEIIGQRAAAMLDGLARSCKEGANIWRAVPLESNDAAILYDLKGAACDAAGAVLPADMFVGSSATHIARDAQGRRWLLDLCQAHVPQVVLFGAGHVGTAIVRMLSMLPCRILWVDEREDMFPTDLPPQVTIDATDVPNAVVGKADPGAYFLVMTHSHSLDQQLTEQILKREDVAWFGLIGSYTKRKQFEHRLQDRGITVEQLNRMTCPIGIPGIYGKEPASIAIAVVAQLMQLWELRAPHHSSVMSSIVTPAHTPQDTPQN